MERAAVLIGVSRAGDLPVLQAVTRGVRAMEKWADEQGFAAVTVLTDEAGKLEIAQVEDAVAAIVDRATVEQLVVYFAGHGQNNGLSEYWLLSRAPRSTGAAVNVDGSVRLARYCGIPHVVLVSDACRTAADGITAQAVTGTNIFPNDPVAGPGRPVDEFYACALGSPSLEVRDAAEAAGAFSAVYTDSLVEALRGTPGALLESLDGSATVQVVRPWPLQTHLETDVGRRLAALQPLQTLIQAPEARINSPATAWVSRLERRASERGGSAPVPPAGPDTVGTLARTALHEELGAVPAIASRVRRATEAGTPAAAALSAALARTAPPFGPDRFESGCGIKVRGAGIVAASSPTAQIHVLDPEMARVELAAGAHAATVVLTFADGTGGTFPAVRDFLTALTFDGGELLDVALEPSANSWRRAEYEHRRAELETLRALVAAAARHGTFRLSGPDARELALRMQLAKGVDPAMALYAAYAYDGMQRPELVDEMAAYLHDDLRIRLFDIELLSRDLAGTTGSAPDLYPPLPMLAQGWALLDAYRVTLPAALRELRHHLVPSLWTLFDADGTHLLREAMEAIP